MSVNPDLSFIIPVFNEEAVLPLLQLRLESTLKELGLSVEIILVDDGSTDKTFEIAQSLVRSDSRYRILRFSRNFGHQMAVTAGFDHCRGRAAVVMDADLQDPPEVVVEMVKRWNEGYEIVFGQRVRREKDSFFKRFTAESFYKIFKAITGLDLPQNVADFRLVDRRAIDAFTKLRERHRLVRAMFAWVGFRQIAVPFERPARAAGETKYPLSKMVRLALDGMMGFSDLPLQIAFRVGFVISIGALLYGFYAIGVKIFGGYTVDGWTSLVAVMSFMTGIQLLGLGLIGQYIGRIYSEVQGRPLYVVAEKKGF